MPRRLGSAVTLPPSPDAPEDAVPPLAGQDRLPAELTRVLVVPAVDAPARVAEKAVTGAIAQAMPAVPELRHVSTLIPECDHEDVGLGARRSRRSASSSSETRVSIGSPGTPIMVTTNRLQASLRLFAA
jgi:hypothetical protein